MQPEMVTLRIGIRNVGQAQPPHLVEQRRIGQDGSAQVGPVPPLTVSDHIVYCSQGVILMVEMSMKQFSITNRIQPKR